MKHLFSFLALFIALQLTGQTDYQATQKWVKDFVKTWSDPQYVQKFNTSGAGLLITHTLDSVVTKDASSAVTQKLEMEYNTQGYTTKMKQYGPDDITSIIRLQSVTTFEYQTPGYASHITIDTVNTSTQEFEKQLEMEIEYDDANRVDSLVISIEDLLFGGGFGPYLAIKQVYSGDLLVQTRQWINIPFFGGWVPISVVDFQYDANDLLTDQLTSSLDFNTGFFVPSDRTTYTYNAQGLQDVVTEYLWVDPAWEPSQRFTYSYYPNGTIHNEIREIYSTESGTWANNVWTTYPVGNVTNQYPVTSYIWDPISVTWNETDSTINLLNPALPWSQVAAPTQLSLLSVLGGGATGAGFIDDPDGSSINEIRYFLVDTLTGNFYFDSKDIYYYSLIGGAAVQSVLPDYLSVAPNPAQDQFMINLDLDAKATYTIYSNTGVAIAKGDMLEGNNTIQTASWLPGLYYVLITLQDGSVYVHKQMVE